MRRNCHDGGGCCERSSSYSWWYFFENFHRGPLLGSQNRRLTAATANAINKSDTRTFPPDTNLNHVPRTINIHT